MRKLPLSLVLAAMAASSSQAQRTALPVGPVLKSTSQELLAPVQPGTATIVSDARTIVGNTVRQVLDQPVTGPLLGTPLKVLGNTTSQIVGTGQPLVGAMGPVILRQRAPVPVVSVPSLAPATSPAAEVKSLVAARSVRLRNLVGSQPRLLDVDDLGNPVVRGRIVLWDPDQLALDRIQNRGFRVLATDSDEALHVRIVTLAAPAGLSTRAAREIVEQAAPGSDPDFDHVYEPAGAALGASAAAIARGGAKEGRTTIGMIDGGVGSHPSIAGVIADQRGFAGAVKATSHGTAVASLIAGEQGRFHGAAAGSARLLVADVYGGREASGSATLISRAIIWLAREKAEVINISLVGPPNMALRRVIEAAKSRGIAIVAAVGNDGPASPPSYPASYPGVLSITAVDARGVALLESGNAAQLDFAAPGADMLAAALGGGFKKVRGTSYASPLAAGRLAIVGSVDRRADEAKPGKGRVGRGLVCSACRLAPETMASR